MRCKDKPCSPCTCGHCASRPVCARCGEWMDPTEAYERGRLAGIAEGRAAERADVVAWFYDDRRWLDDMRWSTLRAHHRDAIRNDIERGDHVGAAGKVKP
jgi:hypothetical protein